MEDQEAQCRASLPSGAKCIWALMPIFCRFEPLLWPPMKWVARQWQSSCWSKLQALEQIPTSLARGVYDTQDALMNSVTGGEPLPSFHLVKAHGCAKDCHSSIKMKQSRRVNDWNVLFGNAGAAIVKGHWCR